MCGTQTWAVLVEAGYRLGDRLLYHRAPMLRGDDVATLQRRLSALGFDTGRVDGIFGPQTARAVADFQRNVGLTVDGTCGRDTLAALQRLGGRSDSAAVVANVRERETLRRGSRTLEERRIVLGQRGGLDALVQSVARLLIRAGAVVVVLQDPEESAQAQLANEAKADLYVGLATNPDGACCSTSFYAHSVTGTESPAGRRLAELVQRTVPPSLGLKDGGVRGMRIPILRETRMPAIVCELSPLSVVVERSAELASSLCQAITAWIADPLD
ncbi:MAG: N-acetylmuramoyl-L-alanine amidase [Acidimicrobiaceae bacterium]|nr:N-acetylmuramoyl-L-alanine amidase [Acidimicrobiaceae bacterium]